MIINEVLKSVDIFDDGDYVVLTTESGKQYKMYHDQDCCERVNMVDDYENVLKSLVGRRVSRVDTNTYDGLGSSYDNGYEDSCTVTEFKFIVGERTEIVRWFGSSNGYYSETACIEELK